MDETTLQVLKEPAKLPQSNSYLWVRRGGPPDLPVILFDYDPSRSQAVPLRLLEGYRGYLQVDGYDGYNAVGLRSDIVLVGCMAHARRKFDEAVKAQGAHPDNSEKIGKALEGLRHRHPSSRDPKRACVFVVVSRQALTESRFFTVICAPVYSRYDGLATQVPIG